MVCFATRPFSARRLDAPIIAMYLLSLPIGRSLITITLPAIATRPGPLPHAATSPRHLQERLYYYPYSDIEKTS